MKTAVYAYLWPFKRHTFALNRVIYSYFASVSMRVLWLHREHLFLSAQTITSGSSTSLARCCYSTCHCVNYLAAIDYYCNSLFACLPESIIDPLQRIENADAHLIFKLRPRNHATMLFNFTGFLYRLIVGKVQYLMKTVLFFETKLYTG